MSNQFITVCGHWFSIIYQDMSMRSVLIFLIIDIIVAFLTVIGNSIFMVTLIRTRSLYKPSNILLGALCFSDLLVGFIAQPITISYFAFMKFEQIVDGPLSTAYSGTRYLCTELSSLYVALISLDRYAAVCHPYRYHSTATCKTHLCLVIVAAIIWTCFATSRIYLATNSAFEIIRLSIATCFIFVIISSNVFIFKVILKHRRAISSQFDSNTSDLSDVQHRRHERHVTCTMAVIIGVFFLCYLPYIGLYVYHFARGSFCWDSAFVYISNHWALFLVLLNSFMNPVVYYARSKEIRDAILQVVRPRRGLPSGSLQSVN